MHSTINPVDHRQSTIAYHSRLENALNKSTIASVYYPPFSFYATPSMGMSAGDISAMERTPKPFSYASFDVPSNRTNFYQHSNESTLTMPTSFYSSPIGNHSSANALHHSRAMTYQPLEQVLPWNHRSASNFYDNYSSSIPLPSYNPINVSNMNPKLTIGGTSMLNSPVESLFTFSTSDYSAFYSMAPSISDSASSISSSATKHSRSSRKRHLRLSARIRKGILELKATKPTLFAWEIRAVLLERGICTSQTLPSANVIQRFLNHSSKSTSTIKVESTVNSDEMRASIFDPPSSSATLPPPVIISLSPSPPPELSDSETQSECSICLATYRSGEEVSILACSHEYHSTCLKHWMTKNRSCPMCRLDVLHQPQFVTLLI